MSDLVLKIRFLQGEISEYYRRRTPRENFDLIKLHEIINGIIPNFDPSTSFLTYLDADGDEISIKKDEDLVESRQVMSEKVPPRSTLDITVKCEKGLKSKLKRQNCRRRKQADIDINLGGTLPFDVSFDIFSEKWQNILKEMTCNPQFSRLLRHYADMLDETGKSIKYDELPSKLWNTKEAQNLFLQFKSKAPELSNLFARLEDLLVCNDNQSSSGECRGVQNNVRFRDDCDAVHTFVTCDASGMSPIIGPRYHKKGHDYDLCKTEFDKLTPSQKLEYEVFTKPQLIHPNVSCDVTGQNPLLGRRFKMIGKNYDLCEEAFAKLNAEEQKQFIMIDTMPSLPYTRRRNRHMGRTRTCPHTKRIPATGTVHSKDDLSVKLSRPTTDKNFQKDLERAIAESLVVSNKISEEKKSEDVFLRASDSSEDKTKQSLMTDSLMQDLAAIASIEDKPVYVDNKREHPEQSNMTESLMNDLAAVAAFENRAIAVDGTDKITPELSSGNIDQPIAHDLKEENTPPSPKNDPIDEYSGKDKNLSRYVQTFVQGVNEIKEETNASNLNSIESLDSSKSHQSPQARFVRDISCPDKTVVMMDSPISKTWRFRNDGSFPWPAGTSIVHVSGDFEGHEAILQTLPDPGEEVDVTMAFKAPNLPGRYVGYFRLMNPATSIKFGHRVWVDIMVSVPLSRSSSSYSVNSTGSDNSTESFTIIDHPNKETLKGKNETTGEKVETTGLNGSNVDITDESFDALTQRFEALAKESLTILNEPLEEPPKGHSENGDDNEYEDDFEKDEDSLFEDKIEAGDLHKEEGTDSIVDRTEQAAVFKEGTQMLCSMGFYDLEAINSALVASNGDVQGALDSLLS